MSAVSAFTPSRIRTALAATGAMLRTGQKVEVLIVGGAAVMLTGLAAPNRNTSDVDVISVNPSWLDDDLAQAAEAAGRELGLPADWFNREVGLFRLALPDAWETRRQLIGNFGDLCAYAAGRQDLIAMKLFASREKDLEDLAVIGPTAEELALARQHFELALQGWPGQANKIERVMLLIDGWNN